MLLPVLMALLATGSAAAAERCGASPAGNGTGYVPPINTASLPTDIPRPGPDILYRPLRSAPQLENTGVWRAVPIMISGATAYRDGEFIYQDWLYDDRALAQPVGSAPTGNPSTGYPVDERYAGSNAADIVEVRLKPMPSALALRITYNSMVDVDAVAATVALGDSGDPRVVPHDAGIKEQAQIFVTAHGCSGDIVDAASGTALPVAPEVSTDLERRQVHIEVPYSAFDPRGRSAVRVGAAAGLWDSSAGRYVRPDSGRPAFFNVAFRKYGQWRQNTWMDDSQNAALAAGDLSPLSATVDFSKLAARSTDESGVPKSGPMNRIRVSQFEPTQGRGNDVTEPDAAHPGGACSSTSCLTPCVLPDCTPTYSGRLQPYSVYIPDVSAPSGGYGLVLNLHGASSNYNHFEGVGPADPLMTWRMFAQAGRPSIFISGNARGPHLFYRGLAEADEFETWADVAGHYPLNPRHAILTGTSMGGYGTYKLGMTFPDLFNAIMPNVPAVGVEASKHSSFVRAALGPLDPTWLGMLASLRDVPVLGTAGMADPLAPLQNTLSEAVALQQLGYRQDHWWFQGTHEEYRYWVQDAYGKLSRTAPNDRNPARVTYVVNAGWDEAPELGLNTDHVYWLSGLTRRDTGQQTGKIDVVSHGAGVGDPEPTAVATSGGTSINGSTEWARQSTEWGPAPALPKTNKLSVTATNIATVTIDAARAGVGCDAQVDVSSDGPLKVVIGGPSCTKSTPVCAKRRSVTFWIPKDLRHRLRFARITLNGRRVRDVRGRSLTRRITLRKVPAGRLRVTITGKTKHGRSVSRTRRFAACR